MAEIGCDGGRRSWVLREVRRGLSLVRWGEQIMRGLLHRPQLHSWCSLAPLNHVRLLRLPTLPTLSRTRSRTGTILWSPCAHDSLAARYGMLLIKLSLSLPPQGQTESGGIVLAVMCWRPSAQRRCYPTGRCAYRPSVTS